MGDFVRFLSCLRSSEFLALALNPLSLCGHATIVALVLCGPLTLWLPLIPGKDSEFFSNLTVCHSRFSRFKGSKWNDTKFSRLSSVVFAASLTLVRR